MISIITSTFPYILKGAATTVLFATICLIIGVVIGLVSGILSVLPNRLVRAVVFMYVYLVRGIPLLVLLFLTYYCLPLFGIELNSGIAATAAISLYVGAFISEIIRGAIITLPAGQTDAARSLGMRYWLYMRKVIIPQAMVYSIPSMVNIALGCVKFTALISILGVWELTLAGKEMAETYLEPLLMYTEVALVYFILCQSLAKLGRILEKRVSYEK
jgi:His/Glu/Gln/Arg/opine family amino acid ABC transporter permease subunit